MAQHPPITSVATTSGIGTGALGIYLHGSWEVNSAVAVLSVILMTFGLFRLFRGKFVLAQARKRRDKPD